jgi:type 1 glutamine amidotransferase
MKNIQFNISKPTLLGLALAGLTAFSVAAADAPKRVLVVTITTGFRHSSIPTAEKIIEKLAKETGLFTVEFVQQPAIQANAPRKPAAPKADADEAARAKFDADLARYEAANAKFKEDQKAFDSAVKQHLAKLAPESLKNFDAVIFANTTGDLPLPDRDAFMDWIKAGHGFVGMHSATDTFHGYRPFIEMIGGEFQSHGAQVDVEAINQDPQCAACKHLPTMWGVFDEIYLMKNFDRASVHGLLTLDRQPNTRAAGDYPIAWKKDFGKGRVFYTSLGHREDIWDDDASMKGRKNTPEVAKQYQQHILGGIKWALGMENCAATPGNK